uniref:lectin-like protein n=1 Tax=Salmonella sp. s55004 TaxID=3159675 RepID=UPI00397F959F
CYSYFDEEMTWQQSEVICQLYDGHLTSVRTRKEHNYVFDLYKNNVYHAMEEVVKPRPAVWIGFNDEEIEKTFVWNDDSVSKFTNWYTNEPNDVNGIENCGSIRRFESKQGDGKWNDIRCDCKHPFICKAPKYLSYIVE